ncbi:retinoschisin-like [Anneissia japonica]|uniref:retinoschisin-like n=1 Tax=Anneissia japonica TaxID=1529436 RepID=UPI0014257779|nr:retinoschisin-like [Anneissia japonica]
MIRMMLYILSLIYLNLLVLMYPVFSENCLDPLGVEDGSIPADQLTASSEWRPSHGSQRGRLNTLYISHNEGTGAWSARFNDQNQWIQVDLGTLKNVRGVITQGRNNEMQWVTSYEVRHSVNGNSFEAITDANGQVAEFKGNSDQDTTVTNIFHNHVYAQFIRIHPISWHNHISLRFEVLGCQEWHFTYYKSSRSNSACRNRSKMVDIRTRSCLTCAMECMRTQGCKDFKYDEGECIFNTNGYYAAFQL